MIKTKCTYPEKKWLITNLNIFLRPIIFIGSGGKGSFFQRKICYLNLISQFGRYGRFLDLHIGK